MPEDFMCPKAEAPCPTPQPCLTANKPLEHAIPDIRREVGGASYRLTRAFLFKALETEADRMATDFSPTERGDSTVICPLGILNMTLPKAFRITREQRAEIIAQNMQELVGGVAVDLKAYLDRQNNI